MSSHSLCYNDISATSIAIYFHLGDSIPFVAVAPLRAKSLSVYLCAACMYVHCQLEYTHSHSHFSIYSNAEWGFTLCLSHIHSRYIVKNFKLAANYMTFKNRYLVIYLRT